MGGGLLGGAGNLRWTPRLLDRGRQPTCLVALMSVLCALLAFQSCQSASHMSAGTFHMISVLSAFFQVLSFFSFGFKPFQFSFSRNHKFQDVLLRSLYKTRERFSCIRYMVDQCLSHRLAVHDVCGLLGPKHCVLRLQTCLPQHLSPKSKPSTLSPPGDEMFTTASRVQLCQVVPLQSLWLRLNTSHVQLSQGFCCSSY